MIAVDDGVAVVSLPDALSHADVTSLTEAFVALAADEGVGAVVLAGGCRGLDLPVLRRGFGDLAHFDSVMADVDAMLAALSAVPVPTIAAVTGLTQLVGFQVALACDLLLIADDAEIGDVHTAHLVAPSMGGTVRLLQRIGEQRTRDLILSGRTISGREAAGIGLALGSFATPDEVVAGATERAQAFAGRSRSLLAAAKRALAEALGDGVALAADRERAAFIAHLEASPDVTSRFAG